MVAAQRKQRCVHTRQQPLGRSFFVARRAVDLTGKEKPADRLGLKRALQSTWIKVVVLDGIAGAHDVRIFQATQGMDQIKLDIERQAGRHAVRINLVRIQTFRLQEDLVRFLVCKAVDLVFDGRAIPGAHAFDHAAVHRRTV
ncbi:hypothetical protein D3C71_1335530 [compost metagenome]